MRDSAGLSLKQGDWGQCAVARYLHPFSPCKAVSALGDQSYAGFASCTSSRVDEFMGHSLVLVLSS